MSAEQQLADAQRIIEQQQAAIAALTSQVAQLVENQNTMMQGKIAADAKIELLGQMA